MSATDETASVVDLTERIRRILALDPDAPTLEFDGHWYSWRELAVAGERLSELLAGVGAGPEAAIGVVMRNCPSVVAATTSILAAGQCLVTLSHMQPAEHLVDDVANLGLAAVLADPCDWEIPGLRTAVARSGAVAVALDGLRGAAVVEAPRISAEELGRRKLPGVAIEMLTSGTTGRPKRISLPYASLARSFERVSHYESAGEPALRLRSGVAIIAQPLLHIGGLWMLLLNLLGGRRVALLDRFSVDAWVHLVREHRPVNVPLPPAALQMILDADVPAADLSSIRAVTSGAAPVKPELAEAFEERYGAPVLVVYGATEFAGGVTGWTLGDHRRWRVHKRGSVGRPHPGVEIRVVDEITGEPLPAGEIGLLEVRSAQLAVDGWVRATDRASIDEDGFLFIHGRADAVIIRGGFKIHPGAVADVLSEHPGVAEAVVVGLPDDRLGEVPVAAVQPAPGVDDLDPAEVKSWAKARLTRYQVPVKVVVMASLPRTPSSKVSLHAVRELLAAQAMNEKDVT